MIARQPFRRCESHDLRGCLQSPEQSYSVDPSTSQLSSYTERRRVKWSHVFHEVVRSPRRRASRPRWFSAEDAQNTPMTKMPERVKLCEVCDIVQRLSDKLRLDKKADGEYRHPFHGCRAGKLYVSWFHLCRRPCGIIETGT
jgi:hypothetical protein